MKLKKRYAFGRRYREIVRKCDKKNEKKTGETPRRSTK